ncbi:MULTISPECIES: hypothetical protein [Rhodanobacter]|uniref:hypothetical protein n=1 Tax=Rhodanobacter TaxID=75309 RepID=UPI00040D1C8F|nr:MULTISPECIES: hypothetical protein [Rhodanobacter]UJJ53523.1 hypothetical protein LRK53_11050 [Rhodanobacter thiooxydans]
MQINESDRQAIIECAEHCEAAMELEASYRDAGFLELAAFSAENAEAQSAYAFAIATW